LLKGIAKSWLEAAAGFPGTARDLLSKSGRCVNSAEHKIIAIASPFALTQGAKLGAVGEAPS